MKKLGFAFLFLLLGYLPVGAKTVNNDSLVTVFNNPDIELHERLMSMVRINWSSFSDREMAMNLIDEAIRLAQNSSDTLHPYLRITKSTLLRDAGKLHEVVEQLKLAVQHSEGVSDNTIITWYRRTARAYSEIGEYDSSRIWIDKLRTTTNLGDPGLRESLYHLALCDFYIDRKEFHKALKSIKKVTQVTVRDSSFLLMTHANCYFSLGITDTALVWYQRSMQFDLRRNAPARLAGAYYNAALCFYDLGQKDSSIAYALEANELFDRYGDLVGYAISSGHISDLYREKGQPHKAIEVMEATVPKLRGDPLKPYLIWMLVPLGLSYHDIGQQEKAEEVLNRAAGLCEPMTRDIVFVEVSFGETLRLTNPEEALKHYLIAEHNLTDQTWPKRRDELYMRLAEMHLALDQTNEAKSSLDSVSTGTSNAQKVDYHRLRSTYYRKTNQLDSALRHSDLAWQYRDSVVAQDNEQFIQDALAKHSVELAEKKQQLAEAKASNERRQKYFGFILLGLSIISIVWIRRNHLRYTKEREKAASAKLEASEQKIQHARDILENQGRLILEKNRLISALNKDVELLAGDSEDGQKNLESFVESRILTKEDWERFKKYFEAVYPGFFARMEERYPNVTEGELRMLCLVKLEMSNAEIGDMLGVLPHSVKRTKNRFKAKYNIEPGEELSKELDLD